MSTANSRRRESYFLRRNISFSPINPIGAIRRLLDWLRSDADKSLSGDDYTIDTLNEIYKVQKGDSFIVVKEDCTIELGEGNDRQVIFIQAPSTGEVNCSVNPVDGVFLEGKVANLAVGVPNVYMLRYIKEDNNWKVMTKY